MFTLPAGRCLDRAGVAECRLVWVRLDDVASQRLSHVRSILCITFQDSQSPNEHDLWA